MPRDLEIRLAVRSDARALADLAGKLGRSPLQSPVVVAVVDGHPRGAMSLRGGPVLVDPACAGLGLPGLLRMRAADEVERRKSDAERARSRRMRSTFARVRA